MRILFVASRASEELDLRLDREVSELQRRAPVQADEPAVFIFLPDLRIEDLPGELSRIHPDVLHISSHGDKESLGLADHKGAAVSLSAEILSAFISPSKPPRLLYLNACDSREIADKLVKMGAVKFAIGSSAPITNQAARASAVAFYERLFAGYSLFEAFMPCKGMLAALSHGTASMDLFPQLGAEPRNEVLNPVPAIVADFVDKPTANKAGVYSLRLGVIGCPATASQVIFFTDDETFIKDDDTLENDLSYLVRTTPVNGILWGDSDVPWRTSGDHRLFASCVKNGGGCFSIASTLCDAIETRYLRSPLGKIPPAVDGAIKALRHNNGAELTPKAWDSMRRGRDAKSGT